MACCSTLLLLLMGAYLSGCPPACHRVSVILLIIFCWPLAWLPFALPCCYSRCQVPVYGSPANLQVAQPAYSPSPWPPAQSSGHRSQPSPYPSASSPYPAPSPYPTQSFLAPVVGIPVDMHQGTASGPPSAPPMTTADLSSSKPSAPPGKQVDG